MTVCCSGWIGYNPTRTIQQKYWIVPIQPGQQRII